MHRRKTSLTNSSANKRLRGYHIKKGLDELGNLDAVATKVSASTKKNKSDKITSTRDAKYKDYSKSQQGKRQRHEQLQNDLPDIQLRKAEPTDNDTDNSKLEKSLHNSHKNAVKANTFSASIKEEEQEQELEESTHMYKSVFGKDWSEWRHVKELLFDLSASISEKLAALQIIRVWHARARKDRILPAYVESTELLMQVVLHDEQLHCTHNIKNDSLYDIKSKSAKDLSMEIDTKLATAFVSGSLLRLLYGAALSRVVHVMTGSFASEVHGQTYRARARKIKLPEEIVEVRQRVAHGAMPSLSELRWVCGLTLQYLYHHYWVVQEEHVREMEQEALEQERQAKKKIREENKNKIKHWNNNDNESNLMANDKNIITNKETVKEKQNNDCHDNMINDADMARHDAHVSIDDIKQFLHNLESEEELTEEEEEVQAHREEQEEQEELHQKESSSAIVNSIDVDEATSTNLQNSQEEFSKKTEIVKMSEELPTQEINTNNMNAWTSKGGNSKSKCVIHGWEISC